MTVSVTAKAWQGLTIFCPPWCGASGAAPDIMAPKAVPDAEADTDATVTAVTGTVTSQLSL